MALLHAGIRRVVVAATDPDRRVDGRGIAQLRQAGVEVELGLMRAEAEALNAGFMLKERAGRPLVTLKLATSLDGRIATRTGASRWLTGEAARARGHWLRATHDAIMIGSGTALADDPALTCRLPGLEQRSPVRIVLDGRLRLPATSRLAAGAAAVPTWLITRRPAGPPERARALTGLGALLIEVGAARGEGLDLEEALAALAARGITRLLVEGGARLAASLLRRRLVDRLAWFQAPLILGGDGLAAIAELGIDDLAAAVRLARQSGAALASDTLEAYILCSEGEPCSPGSSPTSAGSSRSRRRTARTRAGG
jgi:diaminohydroxyphosphoribosylaminopyrimidine deaminase/5-amino-6-(5-phosphoribosylamino)uracil reductase